jgi:hypothetical protein
MDIPELAWAAGFFDGEGHVRASPRKHERPSLAVQMSQIDPRVLERFRRAVGFGHIYGPYAPTGPRHHSKWEYRLYGLERVQTVAAYLWTWLSPVKREQFAKALRGYAVGHSAAA